MTRVPDDRDNETYSPMRTDDRLDSRPLPRAKPDGELLRLLRSYENGPRIWDATAILPAVYALEDLGFIEPAGVNGARRLTEAGRKVLETGHRDER